MAEFNLARTDMMTGLGEPAEDRLKALDARLTEGTPGDADSLLVDGEPLRPNLRPMWVRVRYNLVANRIHRLLEDGEDGYGDKGVLGSAPQLCQMLGRVSEWKAAKGDQPGVKRFMREFEPVLAQLIMAIKDTGTESPKAAASIVSDTPRAEYNEACRLARKKGSYARALDTLASVLVAAPELRNWARRDPSFNGLRTSAPCADRFDALTVDGTDDPNSVGAASVSSLSFVDANVLEAIQSYGLTTLTDLRDLAGNRLQAIALAMAGRVSPDKVEKAVESAKTALTLRGVRYALLLQKAGYPTPSSLPARTSAAVEKLQEVNTDKSKSGFDYGEFVTSSLINEALVTTWRQGKPYAWPDCTDQQ